jgi:hypothetical protein
MSNIDSPLVDKGRLMAFLKDPMLKGLGNCSGTEETTYK